MCIFKERVKTNNLCQEPLDQEICLALTCREWIQYKAILHIQYIEKHHEYRAILPTQYIEKHHEYNAILYAQYISQLLSYQIIIDSYIS